ncbi:MAG TPA: demethylmenaquinone methyltransferase [Mycobacteriales bacterium]|nr:demethylmenaquinone methyltransferase [Mycobacteriales bacterium]
MTGQRAHLDKAPADVAAMFDQVAPRYDLTNTVLSLGRDRGWREAVARSVRLGPSETALDLAAGTGTSSSAIARSGGCVVACDFSLGMLATGARRRGGADVDRVLCVAGDGLRLPFLDNSFDAVTISFGLRNLVDPDAGLRELRRVTKPGGRLVVCEFSHPTWRPFRTAYLGYLMRALPAIATRVSSNPDAYVYLAESIRAWPDQTGLARRIAECGWARVLWRDLSGGIVALHRATKPH